MIDGDKVFLLARVAKKSSIPAMDCLCKKHALNKLIWLRLISTLSFIMKDSRLLLGIENVANVSTFYKRRDYKKETGLQKFGKKLRDR